MGSATAFVYRPLLQPGWHKLIGFALRSQGLMVAAGNPLGIHSLADLARPALRFVNRARGTGTRVVFDELLAASKHACPRHHRLRPHRAVAPRRRAERLQRQRRRRVRDRGGGARQGARLHPSRSRALLPRDAAGKPGRAAHRHPARGAGLGRMAGRAARAARLPAFSQRRSSLAQGHVALVALPRAEGTDAVGRRSCRLSSAARRTHLHDRQGRHHRPDPRRRPRQPHGRRRQGPAGLLGMPLAMHALLRLAPQVGEVMINANRNLARLRIVRRAGLAGRPARLPRAARRLPRRPGALRDAVPGDGAVRHAAVPEDLVARLAERLERRRRRDRDGGGARGRRRAAPQPVFCLMQRDAAWRAWCASPHGGRRKIDAWTATLAPRRRRRSTMRGAFVNANTVAELRGLQR